MSLESVYRLSVIVNMIDNLSGPSAKINSVVDNTGGRIQKLNQSFSSMVKTGAVTAALGRQITDAVLDPVEATFETSKALGELSSLGIKDLKSLEKAGRDFSDTWSGTTKAEFISSAYDIKSGIASLNDLAVAKYTEIAGITAKGTKSTIAEMTSLFATGYGIYKDFYKNLSDIEFGEMFSAGISKSVQAFKTTGSGMAQAIQSLGGSASTANVPLEEQLSILGMLQATMSGSEAGTKYKAFLRAAAKGGEELGLKFTDANNQLLSMPEILGKLKGKFGETMDAAEKMQLQKAFGTDEAVALIDLLYGKTDALQGNILTLYDTMGQGINVATEMATAMNTPEGEKYKRLQQQIHNVKEEIGKQLLPTINQFLDSGGRALSRISEFIGKNQGLVKVIMVVVLVIGIVLTVFGTLTIVVGGVGLIFTKSAGMIKGFVGIMGKLPGLFETIYIKALYAGDGIKKGFGAVKTFASSAVSGIKNVASSIISMGKAAAINGYNALKKMVVGMVSMAKQAVITAVQAMPGLIASVWSFTAALLANPITWIIIGIVALIAALILLWKNWDKVTNFLKTAAQAAVNGIVSAFNWVKEKISQLPQGFKILLAVMFPIISIPALIIANWKKIIAFFKNIINGVKNFFSNGFAWIKNFFKEKMQMFKESGKKIILTFVEGIKSVITKPAELVKQGLAKVRKLLPFSDAKEGPLSTLTLSGRRVFETINTGMMKTKNLPAETTAQAFSQMNFEANNPEFSEGNYSAREEKIKKINLKEVVNEKTESKETKSEKNDGVSIDKLILSVDISKLKDLPMLFKLLQEVQDYVNANSIEVDPEGGIILDNI